MGEALADQDIDIPGDVVRNRRIDQGKKGRIVELLLHGELAFLAAGYSIECGVLSATLPPENRVPVTLILTVGNASRLMQSSDYHLIDTVTGKIVVDEAGSKQLTQAFKGLDLQVAFTGVAMIRTGSTVTRIVDVIASALQKLPFETTLQTVCEQLSRTCEVTLRGMNDVLTMVITAAEVGKPLRVAIVSNADWRKHPPKAKARFTIRVDTIHEPYVLVSGMRACVRESELRRLDALSASDKIDNKVLGEINSKAAANSKGWISELCWITQQTVSRRNISTFALNLDSKIGVPRMMFGAIDIGEQIKKHVTPVPGKQLEIRQIAGVQNWKNKTPK